MTTRSNALILALRPSATQIINANPINSKTIELTESFSGRVSQITVRREEW
jgi:hypothetical protein